MNGGDGPEPGPAARSRRYGARKSQPRLSGTA